MIQVPQMESEDERLSQIHTILQGHFSEGSYVIKNGFTRIIGGADTEIFSFTILMKDKSKSLDLILRLYREGTTIASSRKEFETLNLLYNAGLSVPKPYGFTGTENNLKRPFLIMEKIDGEILSDVVFKPDSNHEEVLFQFITNLTKIHDLDWKRHFKDKIGPDIEADPYSIIKNYMKTPVKLVEQYKIEELQPLIVWLEDTMHSHRCGELVLIHGDYHPMNVMQKKNRDLVTIDWADVKLGDRRQDLAFAIVAIDSTSKSSVKDKLIKIYEDIVDKQTEGIEFFMVLSSLYNSIRVYNMLYNYEITNENDNTKDIMIGQYGRFVKYVVTMIKEITGLKFPRIEDKLNI